MSYHDDVRRKILEEGTKGSLENAQRKAQEYQSKASANYALSKSSTSAEDQKRYYADSQSAYNKRNAWLEVIEIILGRLSGK